MGIKISSKIQDEAQLIFLTVLHKDGNILYQIIKSTKVETKEILNEEEFNSIMKLYYPELSNYK